MSINWDEFKGDYIKWTEPGQVVEGVVTAVRVSTFKDKTYPELDIETPQGKRTISANQASLKRQLADDPPAIGEYLQVEYLGEGEAKSGQSPIKNFRVTVTHGSHPPRAEDLTATPGSPGPDVANLV